MTIQDLGSLGELVAALATLVTLVYLATQIRQNTAQQQREEMLSIQHGQNEVVRQLQDPSVMGSYVRTATNRNPSIEDRGTAFAFLIQYLNHFQVVHALYERGALDEEQYSLWLGFAVALVAPPGTQRWWDEENGRLGFHAGVRGAIDARLRDAQDPPVPITEMWSQFDGDAWAKARGAAITAEV
jgi:hypothetical protein